MSWLSPYTKASYPEANYPACRRVGEYAKVQPEAVVWVLDIAIHLVCLISND